MEIAGAVEDWFEASCRDLPWRRDGFGAWGILVSEVMLQQTPVARVVDPLAEWLGRWPTPADLAAESAGEAVRAWGRLGYPRRALRLHACALVIAQEYGGVVPDSVDELLRLPGIGEYTARAVAAFAYGKRHPVVDTNVRRVLARAIEGQAQPSPPSTRRDLAAMEALLPRDPASAKRFNAGMMELGAVVCVSTAPRCGECPIADLCAWRAAGYPDYTGPKRQKQKRYDGSDRQVRGIILHELRASQRSVPIGRIDVLWPDTEQLGRALAGLLEDGLAVASGHGYRLP